MNPYFDQTFWGFTALFFKRLFHLFPGKLASDEIQLLVLLGVAVSTALVGNFLIWRKMAMLANSLSHTILLGIVLAFVLSGVHDAHEIRLSTLLFSAVAMGLFTAFFTEFLTRSAKLQADASIGIVFSSLFALGVIFVTLLTRNSHVGIEAVMGNVDALTSEDIPLVYVILGINLLFFLLFFKEYKITSFDPALAKVLGISATLFNYLLMSQVSLTAIGAFRSVGVLMVLALLTVPPITARLLTDRMLPLLFLSAGLACLASFTGIALSRHLLTVHGMALSTAGLTVCVLTLFFILASLWNYARAARS